MSAGFVYVLINPAIPKLVKIGRTTRTASARAKELRGTAIPEDFVVVHDELVTDCESVEERLHQRFDNRRYRADREFFQISIREAVRGLIDESSEFIVPRIGSNGGVEVLPDLKRKYPSYLKLDFHSIKIIHRESVVYLESVRLRHPNLRDEVVERTDLGFISDGDSDMFTSSRSSEDNARLFVHGLDEYSLIMCTDLFTQDACEEIAGKHERRHPKPQ
jgi:hypothetical protein